MGTQASSHGGVMAAQSTLIQPQMDSAPLTNIAVPLRNPTRLMSNSRAT